MDISELLAFVVKNKASDLHLSCLVAARKRRGVTVVEVAGAFARSRDHAIDVFGTMKALAR